MAPKQPLNKKEKRFVKSLLSTSKNMIASNILQGDQCGPSCHILGCRDRMFEDLMLAEKWRKYIIHNPESSLMIKGLRLGLILDYINTYIPVLYKETEAECKDESIVWVKAFNEVKKVLKPYDFIYDMYYISIPHKIEVNLLVYDELLSTTIITDDLDSSLESLNETISEALVLNLEKEMEKKEFELNLDKVFSTTEETCKECNWTWRKKVTNDSLKLWIETECGLTFHRTFTPGNDTLDNIESFFLYSYAMETSLAPILTELNIFFEPLGFTEKSFNKWVVEDGKVASITVKKGHEFRFDFECDVNKPTDNIQKKVTEIISLDKEVREILEQRLSSLGIKWKLSTEMERFILRVDNRSVSLSRTNVKDELMSFLRRNLIKLFLKTDAKNTISELLDPIGRTWGLLLNEDHEIVVTVYDNATIEKEFTIKAGEKDSVSILVEDIRRSIQTGEIG